MIIHKIEQGTPDWLQLRAGKFTGSKFYTLMGKKSNKGYYDELYRVAYEKMTGNVAENDYKNADMERGNTEEPIIRRLYEKEMNIFVDEVGFVEKNEFVGFSPDGLVGDTGMIEIKSAKYNIQIDRLLKNVLPPLHKWQVYGGLWICEREWLDYISYNPNLPIFKIRVYRDEKIIKELEIRINEAIEEVQEIISKLKKVAQ